MTAAVDIVNRALDAIAARSTISNIESEQSKEAQAARRLYAPTRDALLRAAHWNFARKTAYLTLLKALPGTPENNSTSTVWNPDTMPAPPWLYEYAKPADCLLVRYVTQMPGSTSSFNPPLFSTPLASVDVAQRINPARFDLATGRDTNGAQINVLLTNAATAIACYTATVDNEDLWDATFQEAMVAALGSRFVMALTGNLDLARVQSQAAMRSLLEARARDGNDGFTKIESVPDWLKVRGIAGDWSGPGQSLYTPWATPSFLVM